MSSSREKNLKEAEKQYGKQYISKYRKDYFKILSLIPEKIYEKLNLQIYRSCVIDIMTHYMLYAIIRVY